MDSKNIHVIGGSKGGEGKVARHHGVLDRLIEQGERIFLVDADTSNREGWEAYKNQVANKSLSLDEADGWIQFSW